MATLQAQRHINEPVFGPYNFRWFGKSLGVNPLPSAARLCNFDCVYCECASASWPLQWELGHRSPHRNRSTARGAGFWVRSPDLGLFME
jgi:hypothetical protein